LNLGVIFGLVWVCLQLFYDWNIVIRIITVFLDQTGTHEIAHLDLVLYIGWLVFALCMALSFYLFLITHVFLIIWFKFLLDLHLLLLLINVGLNFTKKLTKAV